MKKKSFIIIIIIILLIICIIISTILKIKNNNVNSIQNVENVIEEDKKYENLENVNSSTAYFTVQSCVNQYISYVCNKDIEAILVLLDSNYLEKNNITKENVLDQIGEIPENGAFEAEKMYMEKIDENANKYYVLGTLKQDNFEQENVLNDKFSIIINMNLDDMVFSVEPLKDGGIFDEKGN